MSIKEIESQKLAKNSFFLYSRMIVVMLINLYSVRLVIGKLGINDYGIFDVVVGLVTILSGLSSVLATSTQRFYAFFIGNNISNDLKSVFSASVQIHFFLVIAVILISETLGLWFLNSVLIISPDRIHAANVLFQCSIFSFVFSFMHVPFSSFIVVFENMKIFSIISVLESLLKLFAAFLIYHLSLDSLVSYGLLIVIISILVFLIYLIYSQNKYSDCQYVKLSNNKLRNELLSFSGWSLLSSISGVAINQGLSVLLNIFFGSLLNSARAISLQFSLASTSLSSSFILAVKPKMIKAYGEQSFDVLNHYFGLSNKILYYSLLVLFLPIYLEMDAIILFWLGKTSADIILLSKLILVYSLIMTLNNPISIIIQATGNVKNYNIAVEFVTLLILPLSYIIFKLGGDAYLSYIVMIICALLAHCVRLHYLKKNYTPFSINLYLKSFVLPALIVTALSILVVLFFSSFHITFFLKMPMLIFLSVLSVLFFVYIFNINKFEKDEMKSFWLHFKNS
jgi:O-antigen/teichoic acid export membrane protein